MQIDFPNDGYVRLEVISFGKAKSAYDCRLRASMKCGATSGAVEAWIDSPDLVGFTKELAELDKTLRGKAQLISDDGRSLAITVAPADGLGHFVLEVKLATDVVVSSTVYETSAVGVFPFEAQALSSISRSFAEALTRRSDA